MSHSPLQSVHRQIIGHLVLLSSTISLLILLAYSAFYLSEQQNNQQNGGQLTHLTQQIKYQQALIKANQILEKILSAEQAEQLKTNHQLLIVQWQVLNKMLSQKSPQFELW